LREYNAAKRDCPGPCWESSQRSPDPLAGFKGALRRGGEEKGGKEGKVRTKAGRGRGGEEVNSDVQLEQGHRLGYGRPCTHTRFFTSPFFQGNCMHVRLLPVKPVPKVNSWELLWQNFYRPDALPVTQPTASKH